MGLLFVAIFFYFEVLNWFVVLFDNYHKVRCNLSQLYSVNFAATASSVSWDWSYVSWLHYSCTSEPSGFYNYIILWAPLNNLHRWNGLRHNSEIWFRFSEWVNEPVEYLSWRLFIISMILLLGSAEAFQLFIGTKSSAFFFQPC